MSAPSPPTAAATDTPGAQVTCLLTDAQQLERLTPAWEPLLTRSGSNESVVSPTWMLNWWRVFGREGSGELRAGCFAAVKSRSGWPHS